ncbi:hypothetical protein AMTRI_Chr06g173790 [Amborella trichopoda]
MVAAKAFLVITLLLFVATLLVYTADCKERVDAKQQIQEQAHGGGCKYGCCKKSPHGCTKCCPHPPEQGEVVVKPEAGSHCKHGCCDMYHHVCRRCCAHSNEAKFVIDDHDVANTQAEQGHGHCKHGCCHMDHGHCKRCCSHANEAVVIEEP